MSTLLFSAAGALLVVTSKSELQFTQNLLLCPLLSSTRPQLSFFPFASLPHFLSQAIENFLLNTRWCAWERLLYWSPRPRPQFFWHALKSIGVRGDYSKIKIKIKKKYSGSKQLPKHPL